MESSTWLCVCLVLLKYTWFWLQSPFYLKLEFVAFEYNHDFYIEINQFYRLHSKSFLLPQNQKNLYEQIQCTHQFQYTETEIKMDFFLASSDRLKQRIK